MSTLQRTFLILFSLTLLAAVCRAVVPPFQTVSFAWDYTNAHPSIAFPITFHLYSYGGGQTNHIGQTTNTTISVTNVTPAVMRVFVTASNFWGESDASIPLVLPGPPSQPTNLRPVSTSLVMPLPGLMEGSMDLVNWTEKLRATGGGDTVTLTRTLLPTEPLMFWRGTPLTSAAPPPLPK